MSQQNPKGQSGRIIGKRHDTGDEKFSTGQVRMAEALVRIYQGQLMYVPGLGWYVWTGIYWRDDTLDDVAQCVVSVLKLAMARGNKLVAKAELADADGNARKAEGLRAKGERLQKESRSCQTASGVNGIKALAATYPEFAVDKDQLNADKFLINMQNCTLNLRSEEAKEPDPADRITAVCNASFYQERMDTFDLAIDCPRWEQFLRKVLPELEVRLFFQEIIGSALAAEQFSHDLPIWRGSGRNGKGTAEEVLRFVFGEDYSHTAPTDLLISRPGAHTTSQASLFGKRFVVVDEQDGNAKISEAMLKKASGGGDITARKIAQNDITFRQTWLLNVICNELPIITGRSAAIWDRLLIIEFPTYFSRAEQDTSLRSELKKEADGIFMWMFEGWRRYQARGHQLDVPEAVRAATQVYRRQCDSVERWIDIWCDRGFGKEFREKAEDLRQHYNKWANNNPGVVMLGKQEFKNLLEEKNFRYVKSTASFEGLKIRATAVSLESDGDGG